jgi:hypothetical protein
MATMAKRDADLERRQIVGPASLEAASMLALHQLPALNRNVL